ncbi:sugar-binding domain-containing protein, partial [Xanthomonas arboricola]|uniref:sugar-binding domain-containing protein n=1 Tax=Xanthomonas arboricola TaxID=56448 RepID=UPI003CCF098E
VEHIEHDAVAPGMQATARHAVATRLVGFNGMVWYRTSVELTPAQAAQDASLLLGPVDELDQTWVNGHGVGSSYGADQPRRYSVPRGRLHAGRNSIVLNVLN